MMDPIVVGSVAASTAALVAWCAYQVSLSRELRRARKETSRFPMYEVRDRLVDLVGSGVMEEDDLAWRNMYSNANHALSMENELHELDCLFRYAQNMYALDHNPSLRHRFDAAIRIEKDTRALVPEFAQVAESFDKAFRHLVRRRTTAIHVIATVGIRLIAFTVSSGLRATLKVISLIREPSGAKYRGWVIAQQR